MQTEECRPGVKWDSVLKECPVCDRSCSEFGVTWGHLGSNTTHSGQSTQESEDDVMVSILSFICDGNKFYLHHIDYFCQGERQNTDKRDSLFGSWI